MDCLQAITSRRSVRRYDTQKAVSTEDLHKLLTAGCTAPTAGNLRPWKFIVTTNPETKQAVVDSTFVGAHSTGDKKQDWMLSAPLFVTVCVDIRPSVERYGVMGYEAATLDGAAAVENILLAAVSLGLSSCWVSGFRVSELCRSLQLPPWVKPIGILPIGYADGTISTSRPEPNFHEFTYYEQYGNL